MTVELFIIIVTYLGVVAAAVSGVVEAKSKNMDVVGACGVAFITALGGGTLRDLLLGRPVFWVGEQLYAAMALAVAVVTFYSSRFLKVSTRTILLPDALGLGVFTVLGTNYAMQMHTSLFVASLMGITTGIFGGVLRDVICNQIPSVFSRSTQLYATCSLVGSWTYIVARQFNLNDSLATVLAIIATVALRLLAVRFDLRLPDPHEEHIPL